MRNVLFAVLLSLSLTACMTTTGRAAHVTSCSDDSALLGSWRSYRMSQLGPGWMAVTFEEGCRYHTAVQLLFARVKERGNYRVENGVVIFTRSSGAETRWPYRLEGGKLLLQEGPGETHAYVRAHSPLSSAQAHETLSRSQLKFAGRFSRGHYAIFFSATTAASRALRS